MISRITITSAAIGIAALMSSAASANCGNSMYCNNSVSAYESAPTSSYSNNMMSGYTTPSYGSSYGYSSYGTSSYAGSASDSYADSVYGSGSISDAYVDNSTVGSTYSSGSISGLSMPGLGANERLVPTSCDVNVHGADGARVLGCYSVAQPVQQVYTPPPVPVQNYVRVVRPIVYVRTPVPVPVAIPAQSCGSQWRARYASYGPSRCGW